MKRYIANIYLFFYECYMNLKFLYRNIRNNLKTYKINKMTADEIFEKNAILYKKYIGRELAKDNLKTYTEKMQWEKIYGENPLKVFCSDKYLVRRYVKEKIGEEYLIPLIGKWKTLKEIPFDILPNSFVLKTNASSGDTCVIEDKSKINFIDKMRIYRKINFALNTHYGSALYELHYNKIDPVILVEECIKEEGEDLFDYKFLCFDGKPYYCCVDFDRFSNHKRIVYDLEWKVQDWNTGPYEKTNINLEKPINFEKMINLATILSKDFSHVRVDFYNKNGKIFFGEMTFTSASGLKKFSSYEADLKLGELWKLDMTKKEKI